MRFEEKTCNFEKQQNSVRFTIYHVFFIRKKWSAWNTYIILLMFIDISWDLKSISGLNIRNTAFTLTAKFPSSASLESTSDDQNFLLFNITMELRVFKGVLENSEKVQLLRNYTYQAFESYQCGKFKKMREVVFYILLRKSTIALFTKRCLIKKSLPQTVILTSRLSEFDIVYTVGLFIKSRLQVCSILYVWVFYLYHSENERFLHRTCKKFKIFSFVVHKIGFI